MPHQFGDLLVPLVGLAFPGPLLIFQLDACEPDLSVVFGDLFVDFFVLFWIHDGGEFATEADTHIICSAHRQLLVVDKDVAALMHVSVFILRVDVPVSVREGLQLLNFGLGNNFRKKLGPGCLIFFA